MVFIALFFYIMFDFQILSPAAWHNLPRTTIRGFGGLTFGISLIAAIPIYLGIARYVWMKQKLPFEWPKLSKKGDKSKDKSAEQSEAKAPPVNFPETLPDELREPYIRIHSGALTKNAVDFIRSKTTEPEIPESAPDSFMPLPESFDADGAASEPEVPMFRDIDFDSTPDDKNGPVTIADKDGKKIATYIFDDPDFWVADDEEDWFATGKQIPSPIRILMESDADERVLILKTNNIMNLENMIAEWEKKGIIVVRDASGGGS